jgi:thiol-disulfide isomerase/thioredoxin
MRRYFAAILLVAILSTAALAQSRRVPPNQTAKVTDPAVAAAADKSAKDLFDEANGYAKVKYAEFEQKKLPYSETLRGQTQREQKQLAAKYALLVSQRTNLSGDDLYYLGMLHWIAENLDGSNEALHKYISSDARADDKIQTARSILVIIDAKRKNYEEAERLLLDYSKSAPVKMSEKSRMEAELAKAYLVDKNYGKAAAHAGEAYAAMKPIVADPATRARGVDELLDDGMLLFEASRDSKKRDQADRILEDMRSTAAAIYSPSLYYYALDKLITYMVETDRKQLALDTYNQFLDRVTKDFAAKDMQAEVIQKLKKREKHYKLLGELAPELEVVDQWFPGEKMTFEQMRGKVIFLDFWAPWCAPCIDAFPSIKDWYTDHKDEGLVILGVTRYYGTADGMPADNQNEVEYFKRFKRSYGLPYDIVVTKDTTAQRTFGATTLPTAVLIDRKGVIRFIDSGTSPTRLEEIRENIVKLLAEK